VFWAIALLPLVAGVLGFIKTLRRKKRLLPSIGAALVALVVIFILGFPLAELIVVSGILDAVSGRRLLYISLLVQILATGLFSKSLFKRMS
jgi:hypothetical protein